MEEIKVIYEDDGFLAVSKPAGLVVHPAENFKGETLVDWLVEKYPEIKTVGDQPELRPGIVHRLDKDTSGVLLVAKNQKLFDYLKSQFQDKKIKKKYIALVEGKVKNEQGIIDLPIGKSKSDFRKRSSVGETIGKSREAITEYKIIDKFSDSSLLEVFPKTGRTHQIRVHLKSIEHPIVCDKLYGPKKLVCPFGLSRHFLHANSLEFMLNGLKIRLEADLPADLGSVLEGLRRN